MFDAHLNVRLNYNMKRLKKLAKNDNFPPKSFLKYDVIQMDHFSYSIEKYYLPFILFVNSENKATGTICSDGFYNTKIC